ncbi:MAG: ATP-binding protein, partial [Deltaproteobacteria bacterium]|nr:ATP-binding protein [Deltaproteobacteria bacterium]
MDIRLQPHNIHLENPELFLCEDPHLKQLGKQALSHRSYLLDLLPRNKPGIYTLTGARQIGKTTLLKQWMNDLLSSRVNPESIVYFTGEIIDDHHVLIRLLTDVLEDMPHNELRYILLDEVTYIKDWDKGVKFLADAGMLEDAVLFITGSDGAIIKEARMRFPGRRGKEQSVDFHMYPLNFLETVRLRKRLSAEAVEALVLSDDAESDFVEKLYEEFESFLMHGGFLTAMNDLEIHECIMPATFSTYSDWIRGDMLKRNKQERYLFEILGAIVKRYGSQVTWNSLAKDLSIDHPRTIADYVNLLEEMDAVFVQSAIIEDKLAAAPKKARKLMFADPFIYHSIKSWLEPTRDPFKEQVVNVLGSSGQTSELVEATVITHYRRAFDTYYIKAEGEVDIAYVDGKTFFPVEIKWARQIRPKDLKQISKYS